MGMENRLLGGNLNNALSRIPRVYDRPFGTEMNPSAVGNPIVAGILHEEYWRIVGFLVQYGRRPIDMIQAWFRGIQSRRFWREMLEYWRDNRPEEFRVIQAAHPRFLRRHGM